MDIVSKITGNTLSATEFNQIPTELENLITSSSQTVSDAVLNQDTIAVSRYAANNFYIDSGTADNYVLTLASSFTNPVSATVGYFIGMTIRFRAGNAGTGGAATVNVNQAGTKSLKEADGTTNPLSIPTTEDTIWRYDGTVFRKVNLAPAATESVAGIAEIATQAETLAGFAGKIVDPAKLLALFGASNRSTNGYARLPVKVGGVFEEIILQWGTSAVISPASSVNVILPITFPNASLQAYATSNSSGNNNAGYSVSINSLTISGFTITNNSSTSGSVSSSWFAIGY